MALDLLHRQISERNARETIPFLAVHEANATLLNQVDALQAKCEELERENAAQQRSLEEKGPASSGGGTTAAAALRNEARLRDKLEKIQEELNQKLRSQQEDTAKALKTAQELADMKDMNQTQKATISALEEEKTKAEKAIQHLQQQVEDANATTKLAEKQYTGLKETIRTLQEENDQLKDENGKFVERLVSEKEKTSNEVNELTEMIDKLKREVDMLRTLKSQEEKRKNWFGLGVVKDESAETKNDGDVEVSKFGIIGTVVPSSTRKIIEAHKGEATCVRYDGTGDLIATCGSDSLVKVWDAGSGGLRATLRGDTLGHTIITSCDIGNGLVVGGGSDRSCRVWNLRTERMIHQLIGHANKITCARLLGGERAVITASADRALKVWDITRKTYRQTVTLRHSSTAYCMDVGLDSTTLVSGHMDGGVRFWDVRTGDRSADILDLHGDAITSVQFHPTTPTQILTNGKDSCLKLVDVRTGTAIHTFQHNEFRTGYSWSSSSFSPNGSYAASVSGTVGQLFVWRTHDGSFLKKLPGHREGAAGFAWGRGGTTGQQVASTDRTGKLILWD